jgi:hypothetical protein
MGTNLATRPARNGAAEKHQSLVERAKAERAVSLFKGQITETLNREVHDLATVVSAEKSKTPNIPNIALQQSYLDGGATNLKVAENILLVTAYCIANDMTLEEFKAREAQASVPRVINLRKVRDELDRKHKTVDERIEVEIPDTARKIIRLHLIDCKVTSALSTAKRFGMEDCLTEEKAEAAKINLGMGRVAMAERLDKIIIPDGAKSGGTPLILGLNGSNGMLRTDN